MTLTISVVLLLAIIVFLLMRKAGLKAGHALLCMLLGFYLASSAMADTIDDLTNDLAGAISDIKL